MFFDSPGHSRTAELRHRELLAEAEQFRLGRLARAARRARRSERSPMPPAPPDRPTSPAANTDANCRYAVPR
ncbi:hypothetical protein [Pseudonocardia abyssalis]|uniref:Uncharacterized protein n=1 Tax=Pseudonocardia abyssalis TaxID=2792008 RepID=A0ABS6V0G0_9PSEU|nr:hypothetical protein [Pseudonocardia abyssalis]MBW0116335.1 hypothetical protein [Pseudonocardia abyssalis]MBW0138009.1 hypothetical protein [Pseudonocardia abyssalis]